MEIILTGKALTVQGKNINADTAMGWYLGMDSIPEAEIVQKFMIGVDPEISKRAIKDDFLVCGRNFGFGKVHSSFFIALRSIGIKCIVAESFSTQVLQSALNQGVLLVECPNILEHVKMGDELEVNVLESVITNKTNSTTTIGNPFPEFIKNVMSAGGQMRYLLAKKYGQR